MNWPFAIILVIAIVLALACWNFYTRWMRLLVVIRGHMRYGAPFLLTEYERMMIEELDTKFAKRGGRA